MRAATIRGRLLFLSQSSRCGYYSRAATNRGAASIRINTVIIKFLVGTKSLYAKIVCTWSIMLIYTAIIILLGYTILHVWANLQKYQTTVPTKDSHLKELSLILRACIFEKEN